VFIYDVTDPDKPVLASVYNSSPNQAFLEAIVIGNRGYFGSGGPFPNGSPATGDGVHIVDLSNPYSPVLLGKVNQSSGNGFNGIHEILIYGKYLIENYNSVSNGSMKVIDISNPANPVFKWDFNPADNWVHAVHIRGTRMYTSGFSSGRIEIYDLANLANEPPVFLGNVLGNSANHSAWTSEDGNYLYSCRETLDGDLRVYDVRNPAQPLLVKTIKTSDLGLNAISPHNPVVMGNYLYISWYQAGVQVFDITEPTSPKRIAQYDTYSPAFAPTASELNLLETAEPWDLICGASNIQNLLPNTYDGNWAVYPFLGPDKILAGDLANGLFVLDASSIALPLKNQVSDFDGDRKTDLSVFRPATGIWEIEGSSTGMISATQFGLSGDVIVPGDYDGDGKSEFAVYRPSDGIWYIQKGSSYYGVHFGLFDDVPVPADYDADGKTDIAVWRPSNGVWYIWQSTLGLKYAQWGIQSDKPVKGDFDGDSKADIAVWRKSDCVWYVLQSSSSLPLYAAFGRDGDKPVSADFDGNGITDFSLYRPSNGVWYVFDPAAVPAYRYFYWGASEDLPIPADYDGDGKSDVTVYRPSSNQWFRINSSDGAYVFRNFGESGDKPSPSSAQPQ
ncbi:MAG: FG-GAP-like repeat-containing protein, partial [Pyrinomonadaceae bacterium]